MVEAVSVGYRYYLGLEQDQAEYQDYYEAYCLMFRFQDDVYAHKRFHSALKYLIPLEFERQLLTWLPITLYEQKSAQMVSKDLTAAHPDKDHIDAEFVGATSQPVSSADQTTTDMVLYTRVQVIQEPVRELPLSAVEDIDDLLQELVTWDVASDTDLLDFEAFL